MLKAADPASDLGLPIVTKVRHYTHNRACVNLAVTIPYHSPDLSLGRWLEAFTNCYHRTLGLTIELGIICQVAGWATVIRVDTVENRGSDSRRIDTVATVAEKKKEKIF